MKIRIGLVGYGYAGATIHAPLIASVPELALTAIATSRPDQVSATLTNVRCVANPEALFEAEDVDAVVLATPNLSHFDLARQALLAGKHVVIDKPMVVNSVDGHTLIEIARNKNKLLTVFHNRRWDGDFLTLSELLRRQSIGAVRDFESRFDRYRPEVRVRWREDDLLGSGLLYDLGPHLIDQALLLFGMPQRVFANLRMERAGAKSCDAFDVILEFGSHRARLRAGMLVAQPSARFRVEAERGGFIKYGADSQEERLKRGERPGQPEWGQDDAATYGEVALRIDERFELSRLPTRRGAYQTFYELFANAINAGGSVPVSASEAVRVVELIEMAMLSHQRGSWIEIEKGS